MDGKAKVLAASGLPVLALVAALHTAFIPQRSQATPPGVVLYHSGNAVQACDVHRPQIEKWAPLVVIVHGGGGVIGDKTEWWPAQLADRLARDGFVTVSINYRLAPKHTWPAAVEDVGAAIGRLRNAPAPLSYDPDRVFVIGLSSGAQFAEMAAIRHPHSIAGIIAVSGVQDLTTLPWPWVRTALGDADPRSASPLYAVRDEFPPALFVHGEKDFLVPVSQSVRMHLALRARGCDSTLVRLPGADHFRPQRKFLAQCYPHIVRWLRERSDLVPPRNQALIVAWLTPATATRP